ncbi:MAG: hypothetical protein Fur005_27760 [Roseiflexaceae bacterium]
MTLTPNSADDPEFVRHHLAIIFDVPEKLAAKPKRMQEALNLICVKLTDAIERDEQLQALMRRYGVEWGWEKGTWEPE